MRMEWIIVGLAVLLSACVGPMILEKAGATNQDLRNDQFDCQSQWNTTAGAIAYKMDPLGHMNEISNARSFMQACLERRGWHRVK